MWADSVRGKISTQPLSNCITQWIWLHHLNELVAPLLRRPNTVMAETRERKQKQPKSMQSMTLLTPFIDNFSLSHHKLDIQSYVYIFFGFKWKLKCNIWTGCDYNFYFCRTYLHRSITDKICKLNHFFRWYISVHDKRHLASFHAKAAHGHKIFHSLEQGFSHFRLAASRNHVIDSQYFMLEIFFK